MDAAEGKDSPNALASSIRASGEGIGYCLEELRQCSVIRETALREKRLPDEVAEAGGDDVLNVAQSEEVGNRRCLNGCCVKDGTQLA